MWMVQLPPGTEGPAASSAASGPGSASPSMASCTDQAQVPNKVSKCGENGRDVWNDCSCVTGVWVCVNAGMCVCET